MVAGTLTVFPHVRRGVAFPHVLRKAVITNSCKRRKKWKKRLTSPDQGSSEEELRRHRYGRHRTRRGRHHRRSFYPVGKGAAGEVSFPDHMVSSSPQQQSLVSESIMAKLNGLLDNSFTEEGLTSNIADLLSTLTGRVQLTPSESSSLRICSSVPSASSLNTRLTMSVFGAISKFSGNEKDKNSILNAISHVAV